jgi:hypothetical protein
LTWAALAKTSANSPSDRMCQTGFQHTRRFHGDMNYAFRRQPIRKGHQLLGPRLEGLDCSGYLAVPRVANAADYRLLMHIQACTMRCRTSIAPPCGSDLETGSFAPRKTSAAQLRHYTLIGCSKCNSSCRRARCSTRIIKFRRRAPTLFPKRFRSGNHDSLTKEFLQCEQFLTQSYL